MWENEKGMATVDGCMLISKLVAQANEKTLKNDEVRVGCFLRTGMLVTLDVSDDDKIKPQGLTISYTIPDGVDLTSNKYVAGAVDNQSDWDTDVIDGVNQLVQ